MPLLPGGAVMTLSVIILTTSELTSPYTRMNIIYTLILTNFDINKTFSNNNNISNKVTHPFSAVIFCTYYCVNILVK